jgi:hypothetical protein
MGLGAVCVGGGGGGRRGAGFGGGGGPGRQRSGCVAALWCGHPIGRPLSTGAANSDTCVVGVRRCVQYNELTAEPGSAHCDADTPGLTYTLTSSLVCHNHPPAWLHCAVCKLRITLACLCFLTGVPMQRPGSPAVQGRLVPTRGHPQWSQQTEEPQAPRHPVAHDCGRWVGSGWGVWCVVASFVPVPVVGCTLPSIH